MGLSTLIVGPSNSSETVLAKTSLNFVYDYKLCGLIFHYSINSLRVLIKPYFANSPVETHFSVIRITESKVCSDISKRK